MRIVQKGVGAPRPLLVLYHLAGLDQAIRKVAPAEAAIVNFTFPPLQRAYRTLSARNPALPDLLGALRAALGAPELDFFPVVLAGFSEGCQGVRTQLLAGALPAATVAADGIHASTPPVAAQQIAPWRAWFRRCGAGLGPGAPAAPAPGAPRALVSLSQIKPPAPPSPKAFLSVRETLKLITARDYPPGAAPTAPACSQDGNLLIFSFPGGSARTHSDQAMRVLPRLVALAFAPPLPGCGPPGELVAGFFPPPRGSAGLFALGAAALAALATAGYLLARGAA